jgi:nucleoside-diphosphate-sugar epimerase
VFNLGSGTATPLKKIIEIIRGELGCSIAPNYGAVPYRPDQVMHLQADIAKLRAATGWTPEVSLEDGLRQTVTHEKKVFELARAMA